MTRALAETGVAAAVLALLWWHGDRLDHLWPVRPAGDVFVLLTLAASVVATAATIVTRIVPDTVDRAIRRLTSALLLYGLVIIPVGIYHLPGAFEPALAIGGFVASTAFLALMVWALRPRLFAWTRVRWPAAVAIGVVLSFGAGLVAQLVAETSDPKVPTLATVAVVLGWFVVASSFVVAGARRRQRVTWWVGFGLAAVALAHLDELILRPELTRPDIDFAALRLVGLLVVFGALVRPAVRALREAGQRSRDLADRALAAERVANELATDAVEREHEIRNLVTGLSGVTYLLADREPLTSAVQAELDRLRYLLGHAASHDDTVVLAPLLTRLVALRRARGTEIDLIVGPGVRTTMPAAELAQVITNLLVNCERHAPGSPVRVRAHQHDSTIWIEISDFGPGFPSGVHRGIGLRVTERLLTEHGGSFCIGTNRHYARGCSALVLVPAAMQAGDRAPEEV
ncbi:sensor histidine kinase [Lentzea sp. NPDC051213]|uniref:sensor histidine kinase n=1 Tax=Lentzea sp. NPDC051213 TaxID=3364126 RepID=UPI0037A21EA1